MNLHRMISRRQGNLEAAVVVCSSERILLLQGKTTGIIDLGNRDKYWITAPLALWVFPHLEGRLN